MWVQGVGDPCTQSFSGHVVSYAHSFLTLRGFVSIALKLMRSFNGTSYYALFVGSGGIHVIQLS